VDEGNGSVQVCMRFGGEGLNITVTTHTFGSATSRPEIIFGYIISQ